MASPDATAVESLLERAREMLSEEGALGTANALVNQALSLRPDSVTAWVVKCQIASAQGDDFSALAAIEMAVRRAPERAEALYWRGAVLGDLERNREALRALDRAFGAMTPDDAWLLEDLFYEKACVLGAMELREEARRVLEDGLRRCPQSSLLRLALGGGRTPRSRNLFEVGPEEGLAPTSAAVVAPVHAAAGAATNDGAEAGGASDGRDASHAMSEPGDGPGGEPAPTAPAAPRRPALKLLRGGMP